MPERGADEEVVMSVESYSRDPGVVVNDLAVPLDVEGRRWAAPRIGCRIHAASPSSS
jgi:hypothetical protein